VGLGSCQGWVVVDRTAAELLLLLLLLLQANAFAGALTHSPIKRWILTESDVSYHQRLGLYGALGTLESAGR
jgi:hypothetical protein